jgi:transcriptional regulator with XRE-family HTH domain
MDIALQSGKCSDAAVLLPPRLGKTDRLRSTLMSRKLVHYVRAERRRAALTQADVATLLGGLWKGRISWYERGAVPPIDVALAYEAILDRPIAELLAGRYREVSFRMRTRAQKLLANVTAPNTVRQQRRRQTLQRLAA